MDRHFRCRTTDYEIREPPWKQGLVKLPQCTGGRRSWGYGREVNNRARLKHSSPPKAASANISHIRFRFDIAV